MLEKRPICENFGFLLKAACDGKVFHLISLRGVFYLQTVSSQIYKHLKGQIQQFPRSLDDRRMCCHNPDVQQ